jgi:hypothetical protein
MGTLSRTTWTDDDGTGRTGSVINNTELQAIYAAVEGDVKSANFPLVTTKSVQDVILGTDVYFFGGSMDAGVTDAAYPSGAGFDKLHPHTTVLNIDSALLTGTFKLEAMLKADAAAGTISVALVNLSDGTPDTAVTGSTVTGTGSTTGERQRSGAITFAASGAAKNYGIKVKTTAGAVAAWGVRLVRTA